MGLGSGAMDGDGAVDERVGVTSGRLVTFVALVSPIVLSKMEAVSEALAVAG